MRSESAGTMFWTTSTSTPGSAGRTPRITVSMFGSPSWASADPSTSSTPASTSSAARLTT
ncbi:MAG TPA: hypothetical protein VIM18_13370 [Solirubrobacteraceae bacterium]